MRDRVRGRHRRPACPRPGVATKATVMLTHLVAAAIVIPAICSVMPTERSEATMAP